MNSKFRAFNVHDRAEQAFYELERTGRTTFDATPPHDDPVLVLVKEWRDMFLKGTRP